MADHALWAIYLAVTGGIQWALLGLAMAAVPRWRTWPTMSRRTLLVTVWMTPFWTAILIGGAYLALERGHDDDWWWTWAIVVPGLSALITIFMRHWLLLAVATLSATVAFLLGMNPSLY